MKNKEKYDVAISFSNDKFNGEYIGGSDDYILRCCDAQRKLHGYITMLDSME